MILALALFACTPDAATPTPPTAPVSPEGCDPLDPSVCLFPFPSDAYLADDPSTPSGKRLALGPTALPVTQEGVQMSPALWNELDGFSVNSQLLFFFANGTDEGLIRWDDLERYADLDARTVLVDLTTGERVPHFVDLDASADRGSEASYVIRPVVPLEYTRRYAVGVRGLVDGAGAPVPPSAAFQALRDGTDSGLASVEDRRQRFDDEVFPALEAAGVPRGELQLAWTFTTGSQLGSVGRMVGMRDDALATVGSQGPAWTIEGVESEDCAIEGTRIGRTVELAVTAPLYTEVDGPDTLLTRDAAGQPFQNGTTTFGVTVRIPCSVLANPVPAPLLQYGHGLLGSRDEVRSGWLAELADEAGWVLAATDWTGMSDEDIGAILSMSGSDPSRFGIVPERAMQGLVQQLLVVPLLRGDVHLDAALTGPDGEVLIDADQALYYGNSQGAIMGGALMALSQEFERGVLGVSGANYGLTLTRSKDFELYFIVFKQTFGDGRDIALVVQGLVQQLWDPAESAGYLWAMNRDPLPNTPPKQILLHTAIGDTQVTTIGGQIQARAYGAKLVTPAHRDVFGVDEVAPGFTGSALVEWYYPDAAVETIENVPPEGDDPHECPRREPDGRAQIRAFLTTGVVEQPCDGVCGSTVAETCG